MDVRSIFSFPNPVNETSARVVAAGVVAQAFTFLLFRDGWLLVPLIVGFVARVLTGPTLSPLGQLSTRVVTPWLEQQFSIESRRVPGPPKRFAQGVGVACSSIAGLAWLAGAPVVSFVVLSLLIAAATAESAFGICLGCLAHNAIWGCEDCDDISARLRSALAQPPR